MLAPDNRFAHSRIVDVAEHCFNDDHDCFLAEEIFLVERNHL